MPYHRCSRFRLGLVALVWLVFQAVTTTGHAQEQFDFRVLLGDQDIGSHRFTINLADNVETIDIEASFKVTFLGIPVYRYTHTNREVWRDGCLGSIRAQTNDNGDLFSVDGQRILQEFQISNQAESYRVAQSCVMTFAYWNMAMLEQDRLLNAQTGEYLPIQIDDLGEEMLVLPGGKQRASRYRLRNVEQEIDITVWYESESGRWLSLESRVDDDQTIRYIPVAIPSTSITQSAVVGQLQDNNEVHTR